MEHELLSNKKEIISWLNRYHIKNYELIEDAEYGYVVNVAQSVYLNKMKLTKIEVKFNIVDGYFDCSKNSLTSLKGSPNVVEAFFCYNNKLDTLKYGPKSVKGQLSCMSNLLTLEAMEHLPEMTGISRCCQLDNNQLLGELQTIEDLDIVKQTYRVLKEKNALLNTVATSKVGHRLVKL